MLLVVLPPPKTLNPQHSPLREVLANLSSYFKVLALLMEYWSLFKTDWRGRLRALILIAALTSRKAETAAVARP